MAIFIGPAGTGIGAEEGLRKIASLGLKACEIEFTYGVRMSNGTAKHLGQVAAELGLRLSVHAPYYINLASAEKEKIAASKKRILDSCERAHFLKAGPVVFHPGFYGKYNKEECYYIIKKSIVDMLAVIKKKGWDVQLAPETTGKSSQFGNLDELVRMSDDTGCSICVDFAHLLARNNGLIDYDSVFRKLKHFKHIHAHFSGIEFSEKGERRHLITPTVKIRELISYCKRYKADITIINESPDPIGDSLETLKAV